jgi:hypothetical protein
MATPGHQRETKIAEQRNSKSAAERAAAFTVLRQREAATLARELERVRVERHSIQVTSAKRSAEIDAEEEAISERLDAEIPTQFRAAALPVIAALRAQRPLYADADRLADACMAADARAQAEVGAQFDIARHLTFAYVRDEIAKRPSTVRALGARGVLTEALLGRTPRDLARDAETHIRTRNIPALAAALEALDQAIVAKANAPAGGADEPASRRLACWDRYATQCRFGICVERFERAEELTKAAKSAAEYDAYIQKLRAYRTGKIDAEDEDAGFHSIANDPRTDALWGPFTRHAVRVEGPRVRSGASEDDP